MHQDQREVLFGLDVAVIVRVTGAHRATVHRWKSGEARAPFAALRLLGIYCEGELGPRAGADFEGARWGHDGLLYLPDVRRGFNAPDLRLLHWLLQAQSWRDATRTLNARDPIASSGDDRSIIAQSDVAGS